MDQVITISSNVIDVGLISEVLAFIIRVLVVSFICFCGAITSDLWYFAKEHQQINILQDIISGLVFGVIFTIIDNYFNWSRNVLFGVVFIVGIFGIDLLGLILQPKLIIIFIKNFFGELKSNPAAKAFSKTIDEMNKEKEKEEAKAEQEKEKRERAERWRNRHKQDVDFKNNNQDDSDDENSDETKDSTIYMQEYGFDIVVNDDPKKSKIQNEEKPGGK